ncbi:MAG: DUF6531 domain-containing protein [Clostridium sp.]|nr:DUF6531 domain-containing protein [Clostridium sp.]
MKSEPSDQWVIVQTGAETNGNRITVSSDCFITLEQVNLEHSDGASPVIDICSGASVMLDPSGKNTLTQKAGSSHAALHVEEGAELMLVGDSKGSLHVFASGKGAAIGGSYQKTAGSILIEDGRIYAHSDGDGAALGGGGRSSGGALTITGGEVRAESVGGIGSGCSIGHGYGGGYDRVVITSGTVSAQANWAVPAIGVSARQEEAGSIQIEGGTLDLKGAYQGACLSGGTVEIGGEAVITAADSNYSETGAIEGKVVTISGGELDIQVRSSGIKANRLTIEDGNLSIDTSFTGSALRGDIEITGGMVKVSTKTASAICDGSLSISGGTVAAWGGEGNPAINNGKGEVILTGGTLFARPGDGYGYAIGKPKDQMPDWPTDGRERVYETVIEGAEDLDACSVDGRTAADMGIQAFHEGDSNLYLYLPEGEHQVVTGSGERTIYTAPLYALGIRKGTISGKNGPYRFGDQVQLQAEKAAEGYSFTGWKLTGEEADEGLLDKPYEPAATLTVPASDLLIEASYGAEITKLDILTPPERLEYREGDLISLKGMEVAVTATDGTLRTLQPEDFETFGLIVTPREGSAARYAQNGKGAEVRYGTWSAASRALLTVTPWPQVSVKIEGTEAVPDSSEPEGRTLYAELPYGTEMLPQDPAAVKIEARYGNAGLPETTDGGQTWSFPVTDSAGVEHRYTLRVAVGEQRFQVRLKAVQGTNGTPVGKAAVQAVDQKGRLYETSTDNSGEAELPLPAGQWKISVVKPGYYIRTSEKEVTGEEPGALQFVLNDRGSVGGSLTSRPATSEELAAAGLDPDDPENQHLFRFSVTLEFVARGKTDAVPVVFLGTAGGRPAGGAAGPVHGTVSGQPVEIYPITERFYLVIYGEASWMKEQFDVELVVVNQSKIETIEGCEAALELPEGLSLPRLSGEEQEKTAKLGQIAPGGTARAQWFVRGDKEGSYSLTALVRGIFVSQGTDPQPFTYRFETGTPVEVEGGNALHMYITAEDRTWSGDVYHVLFELRNVSDKPVYNMKLKLDRNIQYRITKKSSGEIIKLYEVQELEGSLDVDELLPGEQLDLEFTTGILFESQLEKDPEFVITGMWLSMLEGSTTRIPHTFRLVKGLWEAAPWLSLMEFPTLAQCRSGDPVDLLTGAFTWTYKDLSISGRDELPYIRRYASSFPGGERIGGGWSDNYDYRLRVRSEQAVLTQPDGGQTLFTKKGEAYEAAGGSNWQLEQEGSGYLLRTGGLEQYLFDAEGRLTRIEKPGENPVELSYNEDGALHILSGEPGTLTFTYNQEGRLSNVSDDAGREISLSYEEGKLTEVSNPDGDSFIYGYDEEGRLAQVSDLNGLSYVHNTYDQKGRVIRQEAQELGALTFTYDEEKRTNRCERTGAETVTIQYDDSGRITKKIDDAGSEHYVYNEKNQMTERRDRNGNTTRYAYDGDGNRISTTYPDGTRNEVRYNSQGLPEEIVDGEGGTLRYVYNDKGSPTLLTDAMGNETHYVYEEGVRLTQIIHGDGSKERYAYDGVGNLASYTDGRGNITRYGYDGAGRLTKETDALGNTVTYEYSSAGKLLSVTDPLGNQTRYEWNGNGYKTKTIDGNGNEISYTYNAWNQVKETIDGEGNRTLYVYDASGNQKERTDGAGAITHYQYDGQGRLLSETDARGHVTRYEYDKEGNPIRILDGAGGVTEMTYDVRNRRTSLTDPTGARSTYEYDRNGRVVKTADPLDNTRYIEYNQNGAVTGITDERGGRIRYQYDACNRIIAVTDQTGAATGYTYDKAGNLTAIEYADGTSVHYEYDDLNRAVSRRDALGGTRYVEYDKDGRVIRTVSESGAQTTYSYDRAGNILTETDALGGVTRYGYDKADRLVEVTDARGGVTRYTYDGAGRVTSETGQEGTRRSFEYDGNGNLVKTVDGTGAVTTYEYDALDRLISETFGDQSKRSYTYDGAGRIQTSKDENGGITQYSYDAVGNMIQVKDPLGGVTQMEYDAMGNLLRLIQHCRMPDGVYTAASGAGTEAATATASEAEPVLLSAAAESGECRTQITTYEYDGRSFLTKETDAQGAVTSYRYDTVGNLVEKIDGDGSRTGYTYDRNGNLTAVGYQGEEPVELRYREDNILKGYTDWSGATSYELDLLGRITKVNSESGCRVACAYDENGNRTGITGPDGKTTAWEYDGENRLSSILLPDGSQMSYVYDGNGNPTIIRKADGSQEERKFDSRSRLVKVTSAGKELAFYRYDGAGNVIGSREAYGGEPSSTDYMYDGNGRLCVVMKGDSGNPETIVYRYDSLGNILEEVSSKDGKIESTEYRYNQLNQLIQKGDTQYVYDRRGNLVQERDAQGKETASYTYDGANRLIYGKTAYGESSYRYNALGQMTFHNGTEYVPDPQSRTGLPLASISEGEGVYWTYGPEGRNTARKGEEVYSITLDRLGNSREIREKSGREAAAFSYDAWGRPEMSRTELEYAGTELSIPNYTGHTYDKNLGQYHAKARMYAPELKKFTSQDPSRSGENWTAYCINNPLKYVDPNGEEALTIGAVAGGAAAGASLLPYVVGAAVIVGGAYVVVKAADSWRKSRSKNQRAGEKEKEGYMEQAGCAEEEASGEKEKERTQPKTKSEGDSEIGQKKNPIKGESKVWKELDNVKGQDRKTSGSGKSKKYYEWDHTHNDIEVYDGRGNHLGSMDPKTGEMYKPAVPGRTIKIN